MNICGDITFDTCFNICSLPTFNPRKQAQSNFFELALTKFYQKNKNSGNGTSNLAIEYQHADENAD